MRALWVVLVVLAAGCPSAHPGPSRDELVRLLEEMDDTICGRMRACASWHSLSDAPCDGSIRSYRVTALGAGEAELDVAAAEACIDGVRALGPCELRVRDAIRPIDPLRTLEETCRSAFRLEYRCGDAACEPEDPCILAADCTFSCRDLPAESEPCTSECGIGLDCVDGICMRPRPLTAPCQGGGLDPSYDCIRFWGIGDPCSDDAACGPVGHCEAGICTDVPPRIAVDAACAPDPSPPCAMGALCDPITRRCLPRFEVTGRCERHDECRDGTYCDGARCVTDAEGVPCRGRSLDFVWADECPDGYLCAADRRCHRPSSTGAECSLENVCPLGTSCSSGICRPVAFPDEPCASDVACHRGHVCYRGVCTYRLIVPPPCDSDVDCEQGRCTAGECRPLPDGAPCDRETDCPRCVGGVCEPPTLLSVGEACELGGPMTARDAVCASGTVCTAGSYFASARCCPL